MELVEKTISINRLKEMSSKMFGGLVKAVVDVEKNLLVVDSELHSDEEAFLLKEGSEKENLWGVNIYPYFEKEKMIEFDSMINLRPSFGNNSRGVESKKTQKMILKFLSSKITND